MFNLYPGNIKVSSLSCLLYTDPVLFYVYISVFFCSKKLCFLYFYFCKFHPKLFLNYLSFWVFILLGLIRFYFKKYMEQISTEIEFFFQN